MKAFRITFILLVLMIVALPLRAQLSGYIIDDETGDSIPYASAIYRGHGVAVASNINGHFRIARHNGCAHIQRHRICVENNDHYG